MAEQTQWEVTEQYADGRVMVLFMGSKEQAQANYSNWAGTADNPLSLLAVGPVEEGGPEESPEGAYFDGLWGAMEQALTPEEVRAEQLEDARIEALRDADRVRQGYP